MGSYGDAYSLPVTRIAIHAGRYAYDAFVGSGILKAVGNLIRDNISRPRCALITDHNIARIFSDRVKESLAAAGFMPVLITVSPGERFKSIEQAGVICDQMIAAGLDRSSFVIALGGGVIGDLAGFVAAIFQRGIPWVNVPTTLLAQVDSCIGGKTGVNTSAGKNLIGSVHQPMLVVADVKTLKTLPAREFNQGFAEIIKHAIIRDPSLFETVKNFRRGNDLTSLVKRNIEIKAEFVALDEKDTTGERALLNFGHTVGHAIEYAGGYDGLLHGEAVSLGIVAACEISMKRAGLPQEQRDAIVELLRAFDLPAKLPPDFPREEIIKALPFDKKFEGGRVRFVVTPAIGSARLATDVTMDDIREAVAAL